MAAIKCAPVRVRVCVCVLNICQSTYYYYGAVEDVEHILANDVIIREKQTATTAVAQTQTHLDDTMINK